MHFRSSSLYTFLIFLLSVSLLSNSCRNGYYEGKVIITQTQNREEINYISGESWRYIEKCQLIAVDPDKPGKPAEILTSEFFSALSPEVSYDGKSIIFSGKLTGNDPWQIWEMNLKNKEFRQVTSVADNCIDPAYLPGDRVVYSRYLKNDSLKSEHSLFTCNIDGTNPGRITFNPHTYFASSVLKDGRITTISRQIFPAPGKASVMVLRPDGTKSELFYQGAEGSSPFSKGLEAEDGIIVFIEREKHNNNNGSVVSINYNRPLNSRTNLTSSIKGDFNSVALFRDGKFLVSYRSDNSERYGLYEFDPVKMTIGNMIYKNNDYDVVASVIVKEHIRPRKLPSEVDTAVKTGLLLCQNINITGMNSTEWANLNQQAGRIEIMGIDSSLGVVDVEKDGSFYLKVAADMPFKMKTLDKEGKVVNGPGAWIWLRPNERRGCTGCHEDHEMVPANRYSLAVKNNPVSIPVHIQGIIEKEVELE
jgi:hypothetical protein